MNFVDFLNALRKYGLAGAANRFYGAYRALVTDNRDPDKLGRVQINCPQVGHVQGLKKWVPSGNMGAGPFRGSFFPPEVNDTVWVFFREGDPSYPEVYLGGYYCVSDATTASDPTGPASPAGTIGVNGVIGSGKPDVPKGLGYGSTGYPDKKGWVTRAGHSFLFNDEPGKESVTLMWHKPASGDPALTDRTKTSDIEKGTRSVLMFDKDGGFSVTTPGGHSILLDGKGGLSLVAGTGKNSPSNTINMNADKSISIIHYKGTHIALSDASIDISADTGTQDVNVSGLNINLNAGAVSIGGACHDVAVLGQALVKWLAQHTHGTGVGPSSPPIVPPTPADFCSTSVNVQG